MLFRNDGKSESNIIQNRFTAYLVKAVSRKKSAVLQCRNHLALHEFSVDFQDYLPWAPTEQSDPDALITLLQFENELLERALGRLSARDRYILLAQVLEDQSFKVLAAKLGIGYKGVAAAYYRAIRKIRKEMEGDKE